MPGLALLIAIAVLPTAPAAGVDLALVTAVASHRPASDLPRSAAGPAMAADTLPAPARPRDAWFAEDKLQHFFFSFALAGFGHAGARLVGFDRGPALAAGLAGSFAAGLAKEIRDARRPGDIFSVKDLTWDLLGVALAAAVLSGVR